MRVKDRPNICIATLYSVGKPIATYLYKEMDRSHLTSLNMFFHSYSCELPTFNDLIGSCSLVATTMTNGFFATANAANNNHDEKVKLDCLDAALTLVTLDFAIDLGGEDLETDLSSTLDEAEIAPDLESIEDNFQNALDKVEDKCDEDNVQDILDFIDFSD
jgi:hypothetical protein